MSYTEDVLYQISDDSSTNTKARISKPVLPKFPKKYEAWNIFVIDPLQIFLFLKKMLETQSFIKHER